MIAPLMFTARNPAACTLSTGALRSAAGATARNPNAHPEDYQTRLVFADWLQERDDPRAEGYRALGKLERHPIHCPPDPTWYWTRSVHEMSTGALGYFWHREICRLDVGATHHETRRVAEDAAALAFAKLPAARRAELLGANTAVGA